MKNGLFITTENIYSKVSPSIGIIKKIIGQIDTLNVKGLFSCKPIILPCKKKNPIYLFLSYMFIDIYKIKSKDILYYDFIYIRRISPVNYSLVKLLKIVKKYNNECRILYELPTYPYDKEHKTLRSRINLFIDKIYRYKLKYYIDKIITLSSDHEIFGIPTINIMNGINCADIKVREQRRCEKNINIIAVAQFMDWHGYDRLIEGINNYYKNVVSQKVYVHFVGEGYEIRNYKKLVNRNNLLEYIIFHGSLYGDKLTDIFNNSDIGVCSLGLHRKDIHMSSELKSREYLARGLPIISSAKIDILPLEFEYCYYVPENEKPIDICSVVKYYNDLLRQNDTQNIINEIRIFAEKNCDISKTMKPVIDYLK